jgi:hypothetical protein
LLKVFVCIVIDPAWSPHYNIGTTAQTLRPQIAQMKPQVKEPKLGSVLNQFGLLPLDLHLRNLWISLFRALIQGGAIRYGRFRSPAFG